MDQICAWWDRGDGVSRHVEAWRRGGGGSRCIVGWRRVGHSGCVHGGMEKKMWIWPMTKGVPVPSLEKLVGSRSSMAPNFPFKGQQDTAINKPLVSLCLLPPQDLVSAETRKTSVTTGQGGGKLRQQLWMTPEGPQRSCSNGQTFADAQDVLTMHVAQPTAQFPALLGFTPSPPPPDPTPTSQQAPRWSRPGWWPPSSWLIPSWLPSELPSAACCSSTWRKCLLPPLQEKKEGKGSWVVTRWSWGGDCPLPGC